MSRAHRVLLVAAMLFLGRSAAAATYYVATGGGDAGAGTAAQPWATFAHAFQQMSPGDTLIIKDGLYRQSLANMTSGTAAGYTTIKAENDFKATIVGAAGSAVLGVSADYVQIEGLRFDGEGARDPAWVAGHHVKIMRCSFSGAVCSGNSTTVTTVAGSHDVLFEDCWAWGCGRYKFIAYGSSRVIFRRCVSRHDYQEPTGFGEQCANFVGYDSIDTLFQNCIALDSGNQPLTYGDLDGAYWFPNADRTLDSVVIQGAIALNIQGGFGAINDPSMKAPRVIKDMIIWDSIGGGEVGNIEGGGNPSLSIDHVTIGKIWGARTEGFPYGIGLSNFSPAVPAQVTNSLFYQCGDKAIGTNVVSDHNVFFGNAVDFGSGAKGAGAHDRQGVDPALKYITRVEDGSPLRGAAADGKDIGATVLYRYGRSGTLWGEPGYDELTSESLWPFPNEAQIKADMSSWTGPQDGKRGFCVEGNGRHGGAVTLTSYVWEYLGNACPNEICSGGPVVPADGGSDSAPRFSSDGGGDAAGAERPSRAGEGCGCASAGRLGSRSRWLLLGLAAVGLTAARRRRRHVA